MNDDNYAPRPGEEPGCPQCGDTMDYDKTPPECMNCGFLYADSTFMTRWDRELTESAQYWNERQLESVYNAWRLLYAELSLDDQVIEANDLEAAFKRLLHDRGMVG